MKLISKLTLIILTLFLVACSGHTIKGDGKLTTAQRNVASFNTIEVAGNYNLTVGGKNTKLISIRTDSNLLSYIKTYVKDGTLHIRTKDKYQLNPTNRLNVHVSTRELKKIISSGANTITAVNVNASKLKIKLSGEATLNLSGKANVLQLQTSGMSKINAKNLIAKEVDVKTTGDSKANVYASDAIKIKTSGNSQIVYYGNPGRVTQHLSGTSDVRPAAKQ